MPIFLTFYVVNWPKYGQTSNVHNLSFHLTPSLLIFKNSHKIRKWNAKDKKHKCGGPGGQSPPPELGRSVNPIQTRGTNYAPCITASPPGIKKLSTPLNPCKRTALPTLILVARSFIGIWSQPTFCMPMTAATLQRCASLISDSPNNCERITAF